MSAATDVSVEAVLRKIRQRGGRMTPPRRVILETLVDNAGNHLSAEELVAEVRHRLPDTAESTIYRTLTTLAEIGVISHVHLGHGPATYHLCDTPHRHLVCTQCHAIIDLPKDAFKSLAATALERYGFALEDEHFALLGRCLLCR